MLEGVEGVSVGTFIFSIISVHEYVGSGLQLCINAARRFHLEGTGSGAADNFTF